MGNGYRQNLRQQNLHQQHKSALLLPMLCSTSSIKAAATFPRWENRSTSFSSSDDPLSPKIGCMGQVKRSNRIVGFPSSSNNQINTTTTTPKGTTSSAKYSKLREIFSGRNLTPTNTTTSTSIPNTTSHGRRQLMTLKSDAKGSKTFNGRENPVGFVSIEEMDPPLPVMKRVQKAVDGGEVNSLWKRRCGGGGGVSLTNLQLQQIQLNRHSLAPTTM